MGDLFYLPAIIGVRGLDGCDFGEAFYSPSECVTDASDRVSGLDAFVRNQ